MAVSRQLSSIMFADIAGYTSLIQEDESNALQLRKKFIDAVVEYTEKHGGRIIEVLGDGAFCTFSSTIESVNAAIGIQQKMREDPVVPLRIGIHTGDVVLDGNNVYGNGVNLASRIESFAVPGSILLSGKVYDEIRNHKSIETRALGQFELKNVSGVVDLHAVANESIIVPEPEGLRGKGKRVQRNTRLEKSVMVLPFVNMSNDPGQDYFSDGLTEELITNLSKMKDMQVTSRTTSMRYKNTTMDLRTIARENGAAYILEGSVRRQGNNLRITAQFIDAGKDIHLWGETYRGTIDDIFDIQEIVAGKIAEALQIHLTREEQQLLEKRYTDDTEAYQLYLKGRHYWKQRNEDGLLKAIELFEKALKKDPEYALALAGIADTYSLMGEYTNISRRELYPKQMAAVNRALALDNRLGEAHVSKGISQMLNEWDWLNSEKSFKRGLELNPRYATGHHWYGELLLFTGRTRGAFDEIDEAIELDPLSQGILKDKGIFLYYNRDFAAAVDQGLVTLQLQPDFVPVYRLLSLAYQGLGRYNEAIRYNEEWGKRTGNEIKSKVALADIYAAAGKTSEAKTLVAEIENSKSLSPNDHRGMAHTYVGLGDHDNAMRCLEKSYQLHEESLCSLKVDHKMDPLRKDERFISLATRMNLSV